MVVRNVLVIPSCNQDEVPKKSWGGRRRYSLTLEEEREFLVTFEANAGSGGVLSVPPIHVALIERLGHDTSPSTTYRMLARHGWRKVQPDTKHPKSDPAAQEAFKKLPKLLETACLKNQKKLAVRLMFQDEARFGRMSDPRSCWAPAPLRPMVNLARTKSGRTDLE